MASLHLSASAQAIVREVHDGDTLTALVQLPTRALLGVDLWAALPLRLAGCNARELGQPGGPEAHRYLAALLPVGTKVTVAVVGTDKYGTRRDAHITLPDGTDLVATLAASGWVALWNGRGTKPVPPWPIPGGGP